MLRSSIIFRVILRLSLSFLYILGKAFCPMPADVPGAEWMCPSGPDENGIDENGVCFLMCGDTSSDGGMITCGTDGVWIETPPYGASEMGCGCLMFQGMKMLIKFWHNKKE